MIIQIKVFNVTPLMNVRQNSENKTDIMNKHNLKYLHHVTYNYECKE